MKNPNDLWKINTNNIKTYNIKIIWCEFHPEKVRGLHCSRVTTHYHQTWSSGKHLCQAKRGVTKRSLRFLPIQTLLWFYESTKNPRRDQLSPMCSHSLPDNHGEEFCTVLEEKKINKPPHKSHHNARRSFINSPYRKWIYIFSPPLILFLLHQLTRSSCFCEVVWCSKLINLLCCIFMF